MNRTNDSESSDAKETIVAPVAPWEPPRRLLLKHNDRLSFDSVVGKLENLLARYLDDQTKQGLKEADATIEHLRKEGLDYWEKSCKLHDILGQVHKADPGQPLPNNLRERIKIEIKGPTES